MRSSLCLLVVIVLTSCASHPSGGGAIYSPDAPKPVGRYTDPERSGEATGALLGQVLGGVPGPIVAHILEGQCRLRGAEGANLEIPCGNVALVLLDERGAIVARSQVEQGTFRFAVEAGKKYRVGLGSAKYRVAGANGPYEAGEVVRLEIAAVR